MIKIGLISAATYRYLDNPVKHGSHHGTAFASTFNGFDEAEAKAHEWTFVRAKKPIEGAKVVKIWDRDKIWAGHLAKACNIPVVADTPEDCATDVDMCIIVDDGTGEQSQFAEYPLRHGIPTFCDKPLAMTAKKAKAIADLAHETGTPFMSSSSLRFVPDIIKLRDEVADLGKVRLGQVICGNELVYYGIHALSMAYSVFGGGAISATNVGRDGMNIVRVRFEDDRDIVLMVGDRGKMRGGYQISLYGEKAWKTVTPNLQDLYWYLLKEFMAYVKTGKEAYPLEQEVELIAALEAGKRSLAENREVKITEMFE